MNRRQHLRRLKLKHQAEHEFFEFREVQAEAYKEIGLTAKRSLENLYR